MLYISTRSVIFLTTLCVSDDDDAVDDGDDDVATSKNLGLVSF